MRTRSIGPLVLGPLLLSTAVLLAACGSSSSTKTAATTSTTAPATTAPSTTAASGGDTTTAPSTTAAGSGSGSGIRMDNCAQTTPDTVGLTFLSSIAYSGPDTYMQCIWKDTVPDLGAKIKAKNFDSLHGVADAAAGTWTYSAPDGSKLVLTITKQANGKYYITKATIS